MIGEVNFAPFGTFSMKACSLISFFLIILFLGLELKSPLSFEDSPDLLTHDSNRINGQHGPINMVSVRDRAKNSESAVSLYDHRFNMCLHPLTAD